jgi:tagatose-6-phosphate ketose/aldose isomerase
MSTSFSELDAAALEALGATHTVAEILGQPDLWGATLSRLEAERPTLLPFFQAALAARDRRLVLTGAGSSAFIGELLEGPLIRRTGRRVQAIPTTDIVTHPRECLGPAAPTLLVSFARSGDSPESVAAIERASAVLADVRHLIITCNPRGRLARHPHRNPTAVVVLPPEANDEGLAMTGSFTAMALAGLLLADLEDLGRARTRVAALADAGRRLLSHGETFRRAAGTGFHRAVFLGSGPQKGAARESHLKLQELTAGAVSCSFDSFLGFRHGPKAVVGPGTLLVFLCSGSDAVRPYEEDLLTEIDRGEHGAFRLAVGGRVLPPLVDAAVDLPLPDDERAIAAVLAAQVLGVYRSLSLGLRPDEPSPAGAISRVVRGVTIHPTEQHRPVRAYGGLPHRDR